MTEMIEVTKGDGWIFQAKCKDGIVIKFIYRNFESERKKKDGKN